MTLEAAEPNLSRSQKSLVEGYRANCGQEVGTMRERFETQEKKAAAALARVQQARDAQEKECADMSKSLAERYGFVICLCDFPTSPPPRRRRRERLHRTTHLQRLC